MIVSKGSFSEAAAQLLEANSAKLKAEVAALKNDFEVNQAKFKADLDKLAPQKKKAKSKAESAPSGVWILARKCWGWMHRD